MPAAEGLPEWIRFEQTAGVGPESARKLLEVFGAPAHVFAADFSALRQVVSERVARALLEPLSAQTQALIERTLAWAEQPGNHVVTLADPGYPSALFHIPDPPVLFYAKGRIELLASPILAVVGSRNATTQGVLNAEKFSEVLSRAGLTIASGLALGIDTAAHEGGLAGGKGGNSTIAVIGTGADIVYPARNRGLAHRIAEEGCIVSEYALGTPAAAGNFPRRNRIISGLARGVLVIEAAARSGSLITARMAAEQGREVFAIPGSIHSPLSKGCHQLIKQGAKLVESAEDVLEELHYPRPVPAAPAADPQIVPATQAAHPLLTVIGFDPVDIDRLADRCALSVADLSAQLFALELDGLVEMLPGGIYRRIN